MKGNNSAFRFGMMQNDLTNAVWDPSNPEKEFNKEEITANIYKEHPELIHNKKYVDNMAERINKYQDYLKNKCKDVYNVWKPIPANTDAQAEGKTRLKRTSKAGLKYQMYERKKDVCLAVDGLEIKDVIKSVNDNDKGWHFDSITSGEVRWLYRHKDEQQVKEHLKIYDHINNKLINHDDFFGVSDTPVGLANRQLWAKYDEYRDKKHPHPEQQHT